MRINQHIGSVDIKLDTKRIERNFRKAQAALNIAVGTDCTPLVPIGGTGDLRKSFKYGNGDIHSNFVEWDSPYAHYMYMGIVYGPNIPVKDSAGNIIGWVSPNKKYPTKRKLHYGESGTTDHWFEKTKNKNLQKWIDIVKEEIGKE